MTRKRNKETMSNMCPKEAAGGDTHWCHFPPLTFSQFLILSKSSFRSTTRSLFTLLHIIISSDDMSHDESLVSLMTQWWQWWRWSLTECRTVAVRWCLPAPVSACPRSLAWVRPDNGSFPWVTLMATGWGHQMPGLQPSTSPPVLAAEQSS